MPTPADTAPTPTSQLDWRSLCQRAEGKDWTKPDVAYEFSNGRTFDSTDRSDSGIYRQE